MNTEEPKAHLKKMRLQLFDTNMGQLEDRLVAQDTEIRKGPNNPHKGPLKIEVCLFEEEDINNVLNYIKLLAGFLPLESKLPKAKKLKDTDYSEDESSWRDALLKEVLQMETQDDIIKALREQGFVFVTTDHIADMGLFDWSTIDTNTTANIDEDQFQWMIKLIKEAKSPVNNKYDPMLLVGFKLLGDKIDWMTTILHDQVEIHEKTWKSKNKVTFKKTDMCKFPTYMVLEEREKFRIELYKARKDTAEHTFSKFFKRWYKDVEFREKEEWESIINT